MLDISTANMSIDMFDYLERNLKHVRVHHISGVDIQHVGKRDSHVYIQQTTPGSCR